METKSTRERCSPLTPLAFCGSNSQIKTNTLVSIVTAVSCNKYFKGTMKGPDEDGRSCRGIFLDTELSEALEM
jgi:hypothetical protein